MDHDYKEAHEFWLSGLYLEKPITNTEKAIDSALEIARKLQEGFVLMPVAPTEKIINAMAEAPDNNNWVTAMKNIYKAMITAAQETRKG